MTAGGVARARAVSVTAAVAAATQTRIDEISILLGVIGRLSVTSAAKVPTISREERVVKGLAFVLLYAALEHGISSAVESFLAAVAAKNVSITDLEPVLHVAVLDAQFQSARNVGRDKMWTARLRLVRDQSETVPCVATPSIFGTDLQSTRADIMGQIFDILAITAPIVPNPTLLGYLSEFHGQRCVVAHGEEQAATVGARISLPDLYVKRDALFAILQHWFATLDNHFNSKRYIKAAARHRY